MEMGRDWRKVLDKQLDTGFWGTVVTRRQRKPPTAVHPAVILSPQTGYGGGLGDISLWQRPSERGNREREWGNAREEMQSLKQKYLFLPRSRVNPVTSIFSSYQLSEKCVFQR